jgi:uncharacterized membrane-anchored protein
MKNIFVVGFVIMVVAQWAAPLSMILESEKTIEEGREYRFKTRPVDPSDPFRGKSIILDFEADRYISKDTMQTTFPQYSMVYATLGKDDKGFARVDRLSATPPDMVDYIPVEFQYALDSVASLRFEFNEFYLEESKASEAEQLYWQSRFDSTMVCYAKVKVLDGDAKLVDVIVNDSSIVDIVRRINANKPD